MTKQKLAIEEVTPVKFDAAELEAFIKHASRPELPAITQVRTLIQQIITHSLVDEGFVHPPTHMLTTMTDPLAHSTESPSFNYYGQDCSMMQSLIFHKMITIALTGMDKIFWISPNIRKELGVKDLKRYAAEFTQIDWEIKNCGVDQAMKLTETIVHNVYGILTNHLGGTIKHISGREIKPLSAKMKVFDLVDTAKTLGCEQNEVEAKLAAQEKEPFFIVNLKREAYDKRDTDGKYLNFDVILPVTGEILSGAERETSYEGLKDRMQELGYPLDYFAPILAIAKTHGLKKCAGAGFGVERFTRGILLLNDIADVYTFPRVPEKKILL